MNDWLHDLYKENRDFREYVDRFCKDRGISVEVAMALAVVEEVARDYQKKGA